ncbi:MAG: hypothetical protein CBE47_01770 [Pelagibacteraceae bacterium TMED287]|nr:MAG: hypothetical protein CBE47_01770 [Pelagibacteraceae bacterium TMED287]|tara:strand:- start:588 stop:830 length:243 start_codon:yes stop_codon:yes gene_type:complete
MEWFYFHCVLALVIIISDHNGTLEPTINKFEERIGIRTEVVSDTINLNPPYYIPPIEDNEDAKKNNKKENNQDTYQKRDK